MTQLSKQKENQDRVIAYVIGGGIGLLLGLIFGNMFMLALLGAIAAFCVETVSRDLEDPNNRGDNFIRTQFRNGAISLRWSRHRPAFVLATVFAIGILAMCADRLGYLPGAKERAFHKMLAQYENAPDEFASDWKRERYNDRLKELQRKFEAIEFDAAANRSSAIRMIKLWQKRIERRFTGNMARELEITMTSMYDSVRRGKE